MGVETAIMVGLAAAGAGAQYKAQDDMLKNQDREAAQGIRIQAEHQRQADQRIAQEIGSLEDSSPEAMQRQATDAFMEQLRRTRNQAHGEESVGATSDAYNADSAQASSDIDAYGQNRAGVMGKINAAGLQRVAEGISRSRAGGDIDLIGRASNADNFMTQLRTQNIRANPWLMAGGQIMQGAAGGMASMGYGANTGTTPVPKGGVKRYDAPATSFTRGMA